MQPMGHVQLIRNLIDHRFNPQQAVDAPRWFIVGTGKTQSSSDMLESELLLEEGFGDEKDVGEHSSAGLNMAEELRAKGHKVGPPVKDRERVMYGKAQVILKDPQTGVLWAGSDPRSDGCAIPLI